jgi:uncharacterized protein
MSSLCYHAGERQIQRTAGLEAEAAHVAQIIQSCLSPSAELFLSLVEIVVLAGLDDRHRCWVTMRTGRPGFIRTTRDRLHVVGGLSDADPLAVLAPGDSIGTIAIDMPHRRRLRVNGIIESADCNGITIAVREAYPNCPKYINAAGRIRALPLGQVVNRCRNELTDADISILRASRTFFIGSVHPRRGADASHRGGEPGFVQAVSRSELRFPDYAGNAMFNTLGNLAINPSVGLLAIGPCGDQLQVTGTAKILFGEHSVESPEGRAVLVQVDESKRWRPAGN